MASALSMHRFCLFLPYYAFTAFWFFFLSAFCLCLSSFLLMLCCLEAKEALHLAGSLLFVLHDDAAEHVYMYILYIISVVVIVFMYFC